MQQAQDFRDESQALYDLIAPLTEETLGTPTAFKGWTINHVIQHLHVWNKAAMISLDGDEAFSVFFSAIGPAIMAGSMRQAEDNYLGGLTGKHLLTAWRAGFEATAEAFTGIDPKMRVAWAGPRMSARSSITARLMETWAHGQEIYDQLGVERVNSDRIKNIVILGVNTFGWAFKNRGNVVPDTLPYLELTAPSGEVWKLGKPQKDNHISGCATEFCQVVTQTRNIKDTALDVQGPIASQWMDIAQCFAGQPENPPAPGLRRRLL